MTAGYEAYAGQSWAEPTQRSPADAAYTLVPIRLVGALNIATATRLLLITLTAFRGRQLGLAASFTALAIAPAVMPPTTPGCHRRPASPPPKTCRAPGWYGLGSGCSGSR